MDEIEAGVDKSGNSATGGFYYDSAGRCRSDIARSDGSRRIDDDSWKTALVDEPFDQPFGGDFAALVSADTLRLGERHRLVGNEPLRVRRERSDAAGVDNALEAAPQGLLHHDSRTGDIGLGNFARITCPKPIIGGDMEQIPDVSHGLGDRIGIAKIAFAEFYVQAAKLLAGTAWPRQHANRKSRTVKRSRDRRADEPGPASDKNSVGVTHRSKPGASFAGSTGAAKSAIQQSIWPTCPCRQAANSCGTNPRT